MTKVSVIVAAYNVEKYIEDALHSLVNQTMEDAEFIIVDDCSTDKTGDIIKSYAEFDNRIKYIRHTENKGPMLARKTGMQQAVGEYIMFLDGDDVFEFNACEFAYKAIKKENVDILQFDTKIFKSDNYTIYNNEIYAISSYLHSPEEKIIACGKAGLLGNKHSQTEINFSVWNKIYKKSLIDKALKHIPDEKLFMSEDILLLYIICFHANSYAYSGLKLHNYRIGNGISTSKEISDLRIHGIINGYYVYRYLEKWTENQGCTNLCKDRLNKILCDALINIQNILEFLPEKKVRFMFNEIYKYCSVEQISSILAYLACCSNLINKPIISQLCANWDIYKTTKYKFKTIAVFYHRMFNGGVENVLSQLTDIWIKSGYNVVLYTDKEPNEKDYYINPKITRVTLPEYKYGNISSFETRTKFLSDSLKKYKVDVMVYHAWLSPYLVADLMITKSLGIPFITHTHGAFCTDMSCINQHAAYLNITLHKTYLLSDMIVGLNTADKIYWSSLGRKCIKTINPISLTLDTAVSSLDGKNIVMVCRISREKQIIDALKIIKKVVMVIPDATLTIVGSGEDKSYSEAIETYIKEHKLKKHINMVGFKNDVIPYYQSSDIMLFTSKFEGSPLAIMESKICGLPLVTYDLPNVDTIRDAKGMFVVEQGNIDGAAEKIIELLSDDNLKKKMGREARESAEEILSFDIAKHWDYIFEQTLNPQKEENDIDNDVCATINTLTHYTAQGLLSRINSGVSTEYEQSFAHTAALEATIKEIRSSTSYRLGWFLTTIPRKIKDFIKGQKYVE